LNINHSLSLKRFSRSIEYDLQCLSLKTAKIFFEEIGIKDVKFYPSPISLLTLPHVKKAKRKIRRRSMVLFNKIIDMLYLISLKKWVTLTPEILIVGKNMD